MRPAYQLVDEKSLIHTLVKFPFYVPKYLYFFIRGTTKIWTVFSLGNCSDLYKVEALPVVRLRMRAAFLGSLVLGLLIIIGGSFLVSSSEYIIRNGARQNLGSQDTTVTLEYFSGEDSFKDGYDFSEGVKVRFFSASGPQPSGYNPDFYLEEWKNIYGANHKISGVILGPIIAAQGNFASMPNHGWLKIIDYGTAKLDSISEVPSHSDPRFKVQGFLVGHTYGLFTKEGDYVILHVDSQYPYKRVRYKDWYKEGITFTWRYVSTGAATTTTTSTTTTQPKEISLVLGSDSLTYNPGDVATISGYVSADGKPVEGAVVTLKAYTNSGKILKEETFKSNRAGEFRWSFQLPDSPGSVRIEATASYQGLSSTSDLTLTVSGVKGKLSLKLYYPPSSINSGDYFGIGGCLKYDGSPIRGADVYVKVIGPDHVQEAEQTQTGDEGCFLQEFKTDNWPSGEYTLSVYVDAGNMGNVSKEFHFRVGKGGLSVKIEIAATYPQYSTAEAIISVKSEGKPVKGASIHYNVTGPSKFMDWGGGTTNSEGILKIKIPSPESGRAAEGLWEVGKYTIDVSATAPGGLKGKAEAEFTVSPAKKPSALISPKFAWVNYTKAVKAGDKITLTGEVVDGSTNKPVNAVVNATIFEAGNTKSFGSNVVKTDPNSGRFTLKINSPEDINNLEIVLTASAPGSREYSDSYIASVYVLTRLDVDVHLDKSEYSPGEYVAAKVTIKPRNPSYHRMPRVWGEVIGPNGGTVVIEPFRMTRTEKWVWNVEMGWRIPQDASGDYKFIAIVIDEYFSFLAKGEAPFSVRKIKSSSLSVMKVHDPSPFRSDLIIGSLTDRLGNPVLGADISLTFYEVNPKEMPTLVGSLSCSDLPEEVLNDLGIGDPRSYPCDYLISAVAGWYHDKLQSLGGRKVSLTATTDRNGSFTVSLDQLDILGYKTIEKNGSYELVKRSWVALVKANKDGYREAVNIISIDTPTVPNKMVKIVSIDPPVDFLAKKFKGVGYDTSKLIGMSVSVKVKVKYNFLGKGKGHLFVKVPGRWSIRTKGKCGGARFDFNVPNPIKINGPEGVTTYLGDISITPKVGGEISFTINGNLLDYKAWGKCFSTEPPSEAKEGFCIQTGVFSDEYMRISKISDIYNKFSLGDSVCYSFGKILKEYKTSVNGEAWAKSGYREIKVGDKSFYASGILKATVKIVKTVPSEEIVSTLGSEVLSNSYVEIVPLADGKITNLMKVPAHATTDEEGRLLVPINLTGSPKDLKGKILSLNISAPGCSPDAIQVKATLQPFGGRFQIRNVRLVQATDVTSFGILASGKLAAVHAEIHPVGYEGQESLFPVNVPVELIVSSGGKIVARSRKKISISINKTNPNKPTPVDLLFTPVASRKSSNLELTIIVDPAMEFSSKLSFTKLTVVVRKTKKIKLVVVPLGGVSRDTVISTILQHTRFMEQVYPVRAGGIKYNISKPYSGFSKNTPWLLIAFKLSSYIDSKSTSTTEYRVVGIAPEDWWSTGASGVTVGMGGVVFIKAGTPNVYVLSHEVSHTLGLYRSWIPGQRFIPIKSLKGEEYDQYPPCGLEIHGLVLKNRAVIKIPNDWHQGPTSWKKWFCYVPRRAESNEKFMRRIECQIYDIMGNADYGSAQRAWIHTSTYKSLLDSLKDPVEGRVLTVYGLLYKNGSAKVVRAVPTEGIPHSSNKGIYMLREVSSSGEVLFNASFGDVIMDTPFAISLPYRPGVAEIQLISKGKVLSTLKRSPHPPIVKGVSASWSGTTLTAKWAASDVDGDKLTYTVYYGCNGQWVPVGITDSTSIELDGSMLSSGKCSVKVEANDGFNIGEGESKAFQVADRPPIMVIMASSRDGLLILQGMGYDPEDGLLNSSTFQWTLDSELIGKGDKVEINLTAGKHVIGLSGRDSAGHLSKKSMVVNLKGISEGKGEAKGGEKGILDQLTSMLNSVWKKILQMKDSSPEIFWGTLIFIAILAVALIRRRRR